MTTEPKTMTTEQIETLGGIYAHIERTDAPAIAITELSIHPYSGALTADNGRETQFMVNPDGFITYHVPAVAAVVKHINDLWPHPRAIDDAA